MTGRWPISSGLLGDAVRHSTPADTRRCNSTELHAAGSNANAVRAEQTGTLRSFVTPPISNHGRAIELGLRESSSDTLRQRISDPPPPEEFAAIWLLARAFIG